LGLVSDSVLRQLLSCRVYEIQFVPVVSCTKMACWCAQQCGTWWIIPDCTCIVPPTSVMWRETPNRLPYDLQLYYILQPRLLYLQLQHERHLPAIMMPDRNRRLDWGSLCVVCMLCHHQPFEQQWHTASGRTMGVFV